MTHRMIKIRIRPQSAFATPLRGDTLFGQCCQLISESGGQLLQDLLEGYTQGSPFLVLSDAFPAGYLPRPGLPLSWFGFDLTDATGRKAAKGLQWQPSDRASKPLSQWHDQLQSSGKLGELISALHGEKTAAPLWQQSVRTHNSINRLTSTTSSGVEGFAPFDRELTWYHPKLELELYAVADERLTVEQLQQLLEGIGAFGYGKEASTGCGRFTVESVEDFQPVANPQANSWLTLAPTAPQEWQDAEGNGWHTERCFYQVHVRFGRHAGGIESKDGGNRTPWKNPVLLADSGALLTPQVFNANALFVGQGLTGLSHLQPGTVHQGYSPVIPVYLDHPFESATWQGANV
ncbi:MAG: type III-A CRISPR-associated RAMP protein Csm4 [Oceanobacter sp.]